MSGSPESGTPIDALESGQVANSADASRMAEILRDMNASGADVSAGNPMVASQQPMPMPQQMPPQMPPQMQMPMPMNTMTGQVPMMVQQQQQVSSNFVPYDDAPPSGLPKKNIWSNILDNLIDPLLVAVLVFTLSLPVLQTFLSKYAPWAFSLGGQLSWIGLAAKSTLAGVLFALFKMAATLLGL
jgi:hypothetical protein